MKTNENGFTLVELLIAAAILILLLGALGSMYVSTRRAYETNRSVTSSAAQLRTAIEAIQYDVGMAGYCQNPDACAVGAASLAINTEVVDGVRVIESLTSRYEETRYTANGPATQEVTFDVTDGQLFRSSGGQRVSIAGGIDRLILLGYRSADDVSGTRRTTPPDLTVLKAMDIRLEVTRGGRSTTEDFTVVMANR